MTTPKPNTTAPINLDYAASTPCAQPVQEAILECLNNPQAQANPSSQHNGGVYASACINQAAKKVANCIGATADSIVWTSGATESTNLALKGAAFAYQHLGKHIITSAAEHAATLNTCAHLEQQGFKVTYLKPNREGIITLKQLEKAIQKDTILMSFVHVNHETGCIQPIEAFAQCAQKHGIICHIDAAQSIGKAPLDLSQTPIDLCSLSAHKAYGPKGVGALFCRKTPRAVQLTPQIHGGKQQNTLRSGTLATPLIVGMGHAFSLAAERFQTDLQHIQNLHDIAWQYLLKNHDAKRYGEEHNAVPHILNVHLKNIHGAAFMRAISPFVWCAQSSACNAAQGIASPVLIAMGYSEKEAQNAFRFSFGRDLTQESLKQALQHISAIIHTLQYIAGHRHEKPAPIQWPEGSDPQLIEALDTREIIAPETEKQHRITKQQDGNATLEWQTLILSENKIHWAYRAMGPIETLAACAWVAKKHNKTDQNGQADGIDWDKCLKESACPTHKRHYVDSIRRLLEG